MALLDRAHVCELQFPSHFPVASRPFCPLTRGLPKKFLIGFALQRQTGADGRGLQSPSHFPMAWPASTAARTVKQVTTLAAEIDIQRRRIAVLFAYNEWPLAGRSIFNVWDCVDSAKSLPPGHVGPSSGPRFCGRLFGLSAQDGCAVEMNDAALQDNRANKKSA